MVNVTGEQRDCEDPEGNSARGSDAAEEPCRGPRCKFTDLSAHVFSHAFVFPIR